MKWLLLVFGAVVMGLSAGCASLLWEEWSVPGGQAVAEQVQSVKPVVPDNGVEEVYWKLVELNGAKAPLGSGGKEAHLLLRREKSVARGFAGCNRFFGDYTLDGEQLSFGELAATKIACAEGMELEAEYLSALAQVAGWRVEEEKLSLSDKGGKVLARFVSREL